MVWVFFHGKHFEKVVKANNGEEAIKIVDCTQSCTAELVESGTEAVEHIVDAEELLYEMDANNCNEITIKEGLGGKAKTTYTRDRIEKTLGLK